MMKFPVITLAVIFLAPPLPAQEPVLPYATGEVQEFLEKNRAEKMPSIVLYNFDLDSG